MVGDEESRVLSEYEDKTTTTTAATIGGKYSEFRGSFDQTPELIHTAVDGSWLKRKIRSYEKQRNPPPSVYACFWVGHCVLCVCVRWRNAAGESRRGRRWGRRGDVWDCEWLKGTVENWDLWDRKNRQIWQVWVPLVRYFFARKPSGSGSGVAILDLGLSITKLMMVLGLRPHLGLDLYLK